MSLWSSSPASSLRLERAGFKFGDRGTHTSRTMMLREIGELLSNVPATASRETYAASIVDENLLGKSTASTRTITLQRLTELYALDPAVPIFRALRRAWGADEPGRPLIALLCSLARDPLLRSTASMVLELPVGAELNRGPFIEAIRAAVGSRHNAATLDKVARNTASTWEQAGHLTGRVRKIRRLVTPTPGAVAFAAWLGATEGGSGESLLVSRWARVLDRSAAELVHWTIQAKQLGLLGATIGGGVTLIDTGALDMVAGVR